MERGGGGGRMAGVLVCFPETKNQDGASTHKEEPEDGCHEGLS